MISTMSTDQQTTPYKTGPQGYNRRSGQKTLVFVGICITLVTILSILSILAINK